MNICGCHNKAALSLKLFKEPGVGQAAILHDGLPHSRPVLIQLSSLGSMNAGVACLGSVVTKTRNDLQCTMTYNDLQ